MFHIGPQGAQRLDMSKMSGQLRCRLLHNKKIEVRLFWADLSPIGALLGDPLEIGKTYTVVVSAPRGRLFEKNYTDEAEAKAAFKAAVAEYEKYTPTKKDLTPRPPTFIINGQKVSSLEWERSQKEEEDHA